MQINVDRISYQYCKIANKIRTLTARKNHPSPICNAIKIQHFYIKQLFKSLNPSYGMEKKYFVFTTYTVEDTHSYDTIM